MPPLCRETSVSRTANVGTVGMNGLSADKVSTAIRRAAVREASASGHHGKPIKGLPETPRTLQQFYTDGFEGA